MQLVTFERVDHFIGRIQLNDAERLNAMSEGMAVEFARTVQLVAQEKDLRAVILTGAGRAFSAGGDLEMLEKKRALGAAENRKRMIDFYHAFLSILELEVPVIAAIGGAAVGAGLCLASACDIRIASPRARFGFPFVRLGLHPGMGATYYLPEVVGYAAAAELMLTGRTIEAEEALRLGLISRIVEEEKLHTESEVLAKEISANSPEAVKQLVQTLRSTRRASREGALEREASCQAINYASPEFAEGIRAAREQRKPAF